MKNRRMPSPNFSMSEERRHNRFGPHDGPRNQAHSGITLPESAQDTAAARYRKKKAARKKENLAATETHKSDDLTQIRGIAGMTAQKLSAMGVTTYTQIATWGEREVDKMSQALDFPDGRIIREDWTGQARVLASGGYTAYSLRKKYLLDPQSSIKGGQSPSCLNARSALAHYLRGHGDPDQG